MYICIYVCIYIYHPFMVILEIFWHCFSHMIDIDTKNLDDDDDVIIFSGSCSWSEGMWAAKSSETMTP